MVSLPKHHLRQGRDHVNMIHPYIYIYVYYIILLSIVDYCCMVHAIYIDIFLVLVLSKGIIPSGNQTLAIGNPPFSLMIFPAINLHL